MSHLIHGLKCAACQQPIDLAGVTCAACSATHHHACYQSKAHCSSCSSGKEPLAFTMQPGPSSALPSFLLATFVAGFTGFLLWACSGGRIEPHSPAVTRHVEVTAISVPRPLHRDRPVATIQRIQISPSGPVNVPRTSPLPQMFRGTDPAHLVGEPIYFPGRVMVRVPPGVGPSGDATVRVSFGSQPVVRLLVEIQPVVPAEQGRMAMLCVRGAESRDVAFDPLRPGPLFVPVDLSRPLTEVVLFTSGGQQQITRVIGLHASPPPGEYRSAQKTFTVAAADGATLTLSDEKGATYRVPRPAVSLTPGWDPISLAQPGSATVVRLRPDGSGAVAFGPAQKWMMPIHAINQDPLGMSLPVPPNVIGRDWLGGLASYLMLRTWPDSTPTLRMYNANLELQASAFADGRVVLSGVARSIPIGQQRDLNQLADWLATPLVSTSPPHRTGHCYGMRMHHWPAGGKVIPGGSAERELARFLRQEFLPGIQRLAPSTPIVPGEKVTLSVRETLGRRCFPDLCVVMLSGPNNVILRIVDDSCEPAPELTMPRSFLPDGPVPHVGEVVLLSRGAPPALK